MSPHDIAPQNAARQDERRERDVERLRKDVEDERRQRLRAEESVQQLRADLLAGDERSERKDALMQVTTLQLLLQPISWFGVFLVSGLGFPCTQQMLDTKWWHLMREPFHINILNARRRGILALCTRYRETCLACANADMTYSRCSACLMASAARARDFEGRGEG